MLDPRMVWKCRIITHAWSRLTVVVRFVERSWNNKLKVLRIQRQCRGLYLNLFNFFITAPQILLFLCINQNSCCLQDILAQSWKVYICLLFVLEVSLRYIIYYTQSVCFPFFFFFVKNLWKCSNTHILVVPIHAFLMNMYLQSNVTNFRKHLKYRKIGKSFFKKSLCHACHACHAYMD